MIICIYLYSGCFIYTHYTQYFLRYIQNIYIHVFHIEEKQIETSPFQKKVETTSRGASGVDASALVVSMATKTEDPIQGCRFVPGSYIFGNNPPQMVPMDVNIGFLWIEI